MVAKPREKMEEELMEGHTHFSPPDKQGGGHGLTETNLGRGVRSES